MFPNRPTRFTRLWVGKIHPRLIRIRIHRHGPHTRTMLVHQALSRPFGGVFEVVVIETGLHPIEVLFNRSSTRRTVRSPSPFHTASFQRYWPQPTAIRQDCIRAYKLGCKVSHDGGDFLAPGVVEAGCCSTALRLTLLA